MFNRAEDESFFQRSPLITRRAFLMELHFGKRFPGFRYKTLILAVGQVIFCLPRQSDRQSSSFTEG
ncbi:hypothetical protein B1H10_04530 [candidate division KSB1 bacterium 4484_188]|nr:MAG: hypothetical protein B1H10_04530 [candidate division KSB1 bacterium 4484_188]